MRTNYGLQPTEDQVQSAKGWIEANMPESAARLTVELAPDARTTEYRP